MHLAFLKEWKEISLIINTHFRFCHILMYVHKNWLMLKEKETFFCYSRKHKAQVILPLVLVLHASTCQLKHYLSFISSNKIILCNFYWILRGFKLNTKWSQGNGYYVLGFLVSRVKRIKSGLIQNHYENCIRI